MQIEAADSSSHGRASKRKSAVVNAPTGQMSVVLPEKTESNPGSEKVMILHRTGAVIEAEDRVAHDLILKADAARTLDAAFLVEDDQIAKRHTLSEAQLFIKEEAALAGSMRHGEVLQRALAALIADRAIQRMRSEQELNRASLSILRLLRFAMRTTMPSSTLFVQAVSSLGRNWIFGAPFSITN